MRPLKTVILYLALLFILYDVLLPIKAQENPAQSSAETTAPKPHPEVQTLLVKGHLAYQAGKLDAAEPNFTEALKTAESAKDFKGEADALLGLADIASDRYQPEMALDLYRKALDLCRAQGYKGGESSTLRAIGRVYSDTGQPQMALEYFAQALPVYRAVKDISGEAGTLTDIGEVYFRTGQPQKALEQYEQALPVFIANGNRRGEAGTLNDIGGVYSDTGQWYKAMNYYKQAFGIYRAISDLNGNANTLISIGSVYFFTGQPQKALEQYKQALPVFRANGNKRGEAVVLEYIGSAYADTRQWQKAIEYYQQALLTRQSVGNKAEVAYTLTDIGIVYAAVGQQRKALDQFEQALATLRTIGDKNGEAFVLGNMGSVEESRGHLGAAEENYKQEIAVLETYRENLGTLSSAKLSFLQAYLPVYHRYLYLLLKQGKSVDAFEMVQKTKARALLDLMATGKVELTSRLKPEEKATEQELRFQVNRLHSAMIAEAARNELGSKKRYEDLAAQLAQAESTLETFRDSLYNRYPDLQRKRAAHTLTLAETGKFLPADTGLLEYVTLTTGKGKDRITQTHLFVVTMEQGHPIVHTYPIGKTYNELTECIDQFRNACVQPGQPYTKKARELSVLLLPQGVMKQVAGKERLVICPDGPLWGVPFQALIVADGKFLIQKFELAYAYSATGAEAVIRGRENKKRLAPTRTLLAFANPDFGGAARFGHTLPLNLQRPIDRPSRPIDRPSRVLHAPAKAVAQNLVTQRGGIVPLPGTQKEAEALQRDFHGRPPAVMILTGRLAQKATALAEMGKYRYLHFATHGWLNDTVPLLSSIVLAQPTRENKTEGDEGLLTAREIFDLNLSAEMVVLSACNTAQGNNQSGEGIIGLTWALFVAGAPTQVVSQWSVNDASTAELMKSFYANLTQKHMAKGAALRQAMLRLLKTERYKHPYYWAPFVLVGDWN